MKLFTKKLLGYLRLQFVSNFYSKSVDLSKIVNFLKNLGQLKKELKKIGTIYYYKIVYIKKPLGRLQLWLVNSTLILQV